MSADELKKLSLDSKDNSTNKARPSSISSSPNSSANLALGSLNAARGKPSVPQAGFAGGGMDPAVLARIAKFAERNKTGNSTTGSSTKDTNERDIRPSAPPLKIGGGGLGARRGMKLNTNAIAASNGNNNIQENAFKKYAHVVDSATGSLKFKGAVLSSTGIDFGNGREFKVKLDDFQKLEELGKGNYGTVWKVLHKLTGVHMAMKELRLSLEESVFASIIMELDVLHKASCPEIVEFYGAFFVEGCVYILMEYMDCGSLEKLYTTNVEEGVLAKITLSTVRGLRTLKDTHNIIHRDVKPTNVLINSTGQVKLCDFGVSGNLVASIAKTNIGCQSYMAPERIRSENVNSGPSTYTVQSDIWSLGLSILELAKGGYPYPPETYNNIFAQLQAITEGVPPELDAHVYSEEARDFVKQCLHKKPSLRPPYATLLQHPWLVRWQDEVVDMAGWVAKAQQKTLQEKEKGTVKPVPAMHSFEKNLVAGKAVP